MKKLFMVCGLALILATVFSLIARPVPIEQKLIKIHASDVLDGFPGIEDEPVEVQAILLDLADDPLLVLKAQAAFIRYPDMARNQFRLYGTEPEFQDILRQYGENILPPIHHFISQPIHSIELMNQAAQRYQAVKRYFNGTQASDVPNSAPDNEAQNRRRTLSPEERGWFAVNFIHSEGHDFLGQFIVDDQGDTQWIVTERVLEGVNQFFTSGIRGLETNYRAGEELTLGDFGWASVDVLMFASAVKVLGVGRAAAATTKGASRGTRSAALAVRVSQSGRLVLNSARYAKWPLIIGAGYLVVSHPSLISDLFAGLAEVLDYPVLAVQIVGWFLLLLPALYLGRWLLWLLSPLLTGLLRTAQVMLASLSGRGRRGSGYGEW
ncbi:hypothetical protein [Marinobacter caseinilyticus]|uniref:hypothetical protein n=1 Tax=Marinobacter caseinilyticus TaxID=2692195 RepID=UPI00140DCC62|nr:hypothetical protein [Marinobacter caseinilyticus]